MYCVKCTRGHLFFAFFFFLMLGIPNRINKAQIQHINKNYVGDITRYNIAQNQIRCIPLLRFGHIFEMFNERGSGGSVVLHALQNAAVREAAELNRWPLELRG